ncbi:MAG: hypothetical protein D3909_11710 [Candidatus Electrothrix sp. ATG1]|nr:hypothetical protein [Candidatus Electrothrix sp. ATG1]
MIDLNPLENDAMLEVFNIAMGMAGTTLSQMVNDEVTLEVPSIKFFTVKELLKTEEIMTNKPLVAVTQRVSGVFNSDAVLMFTEDNALYVVQQMMDEDFDEILPADQFSEIQQEAMIEIGNVVLNACISSIANMFQIEVHVSVPCYQITTYREFFTGKNRSGNSSNGILMLLITFGLRRHEMEGRLSFLMDVPALQEFKQQLQNFIKGYSG